MGEDISWDLMETLDKFTLVGRFMGKTMSVKAVNKWVEDCWMGELGSVPVMEGLVRGWFAFNFQIEEHLLWVLNRNWSFE